jgi:hypothetical protein
MYIWCILKKPFLGELVAKQQNSMQRLLDEIEALLQSPQPRPWPIYQTKLYQQWLAQRQLLLRAREILALMLESPPEVSPEAISQAATQEAISQAALVAPQAALAEISQNLQQFRGDLLAPLQQEVQQLLAQRRELQLDITQLEERSALLHQQLSIQPNQNASDLSRLTMDAAQSQQVHDRVLGLLNRLDSSIQLTFGALDQDIETYRIALTRKVEQLYDLGQRSETIVALLLQQVVEQAIVAVNQRSPDLEATLQNSTIRATADAQLDSPASNLQTSTLQTATPQTVSPTPSTADTINTLAELPAQLGLSTDDRPLNSDEASVSSPTMGHESALSLDGFNDLFDS